MLGRAQLAQGALASSKEKYKITGKAPQKDLGMSDEARYAPMQPTKSEVRFLGLSEVGEMGRFLALNAFLDCQS